MIFGRLVFAGAVVPPGSLLHRRLTRDGNPASEGATMSEQQITAWLATQQDAMVALLREMVDIDSGSYNKPGIDAVGAVVRRFLESHGHPVETLPQSRHGDCLRAAVPWDGPQGNAGGNIVLMGHRDTVFPGRRGGPAAVHHPRRHRLRAGRRRHEGRPGDELLHPGRLRQIRRRAGAAGRPVHRRRGDRLARRPPGHRSRGAPRPRGVQQRARPRLRQRRHRPQGRRVHGIPHHRQGGPFRRQFHRRASARSRNWPARSRRSTR